MNKELTKAEMRIIMYKQEQELECLKELLNECVNFIDNYNHTFQTNDWKMSSELIYKIKKMMD